ncbi:fluoride efflux transporter CrcB [Abiotrophia defectiva]|mgnify:FL=1|uniref:fluoride efflux transporter CrcB n=1 Tax=Abiotrophia defectiva TaxID=46125 RepID=UPI0028F118C8|nr:fluoride efflux transporter CrcB [Abiotrophia defectiva]
MEFVLVGVGGALGAILRYLLGLLPYQGSFPFKTWAINLVGSFLIGWLSARLGRQAWFPGDQLLLITGLCGGFTTFSTFSLENLELLQAGHYSQALLYMASSLVLGLACVALGYYLGKL